MAAAQLLNLVRMTTATTGTGTITLGSAVAGFLTFAGAGATNGSTYRYAIKDGANSEIGYGVYTSAGTTLTRNVEKSTNANNPISLSGSAEVFVTPSTADFLKSVVVQTFTASGTYTPTAGMIYCIIEAVGGGGGGGGAQGSGTLLVFSGAGGGSGGYSRRTSTAATVGASQVVTIGAAGAGGAAGQNNGTAGGNTSVGTLCVANGGAGGGGGSAAAFAVGGGGGAAGTGDIAAAGTPGDYGFYSNLVGTSGNTQAAGGNGGSSFFGGGAVGAQSANGASAGAYGSGGAGGNSFNNTNAYSGGNGSAGFVIITEFVSQ